MRKAKRNFIYFLLLIVFIGGIAGIIWQKDYFLPNTPGTIYAVECYDNDDVLLDTFSIRLNSNLEPLEDVTFPTAPTIDGYTFASWYFVSADEENLVINYKAVYNYQLAINFYDINMDLIDTLESTYNTLGELVGDLVTPTAPTIEDYTFSGWEPIENGYQAVYTHDGIPYTVNCLDVSGNNIASFIIYMDGGGNVVGEVNFPTAPTIDGYTFDNYYFISADEENFILTYQISYFHYYTGTFYADDGLTETLATRNVQLSVVGNEVYNGDWSVDLEPTKEGYSFGGWKIVNFDNINFTYTVLAIWFEEQ